MSEIRCAHCEAEIIYRDDLGLWVSEDEEGDDRPDCSEAPLNDNKEFLHEPNVEGASRATLKGFDEEDWLLKSAASAYAHYEYAQRVEEAWRFITYALSDFRGHPLKEEATGYIQLLISAFKGHAIERILMTGVIDPRARDKARELVVQRLIETRSNIDYMLNDNGSYLGWISDGSDGLKAQIRAAIEVERARERGDS